MQLFYVLVAYGSGLASLLNFIIMKVRVKTAEVYMRRAERMELLRQKDAVAERAEAEEKCTRPLKIAILHPDLGIGGAERLILDMAIGLQRHQLVRPVDITIVTTHHDPRRCFKETVDGTLKVVVRGGWLPASIAGRAKVLCATLRMCIAAFSICWSSPDVDVFIVDQVAATMPLLRFFAPCSPILFYCHFPDQKCDPNRNPDGTFKSTSNPQGIAQFRAPLTATTEAQAPVTADAIAGAAAGATTAAASTPGGGATRPLMHGAYRSFFDNIEAISMKVADRILCNSKFTRSVTLDTFPEIRGRIDEVVDVLYPPVAPPPPPPESVTSGAERAPDETKEMAALEAALATHITFVSISRFERKKDVLLAVEAFARLLERSPKREELMLIVAGGCDPRLAENVAYYKEVEEAATGRLAISPSQFMMVQNIPDAEKRMLLAGMHALLYTPSNEHFGIVPVEAMMYGKPVIAVNLGGPCESIGDATADPDGAGGLLCEPSADAFSAAMELLVNDPKLAARLGAQGKRRAEERFSLTPFSAQLIACVTALCERGDALIMETYGKDAAGKGGTSPVGDSADADGAADKPAFLLQQVKKDN